MTFKDLVYAVMTDILEPLTLIILALAVVYFLWNIAEVIRQGDNPEELGKLKTKAMWGVIGIAVMVSLWGLVQMLVNTFVPDTTPPMFNSGNNRTGGSAAPGSNIPVVPASQVGRQYDVIRAQPLPGGGEVIRFNF